jgi:hypothetical protein
MAQAATTIRRMRIARCGMLSYSKPAAEIDHRTRHNREPDEKSRFGLVITAEPSDQQDAQNLPDCLFVVLVPAILWMTQERSGSVNKRHPDDHRRHHGKPRSRGPVVQPLGHEERLFAGDLSLLGLGFVQGSRSLPQPIGPRLLPVATERRRTPSAGARL